ncbi:MAG: transcriptional regulator PpsR, partial [Pseudomonadota bacterium]
QALEGVSAIEREINHAMVDGDDAPVSYNSIALDDHGTVVLFGKNIARVASLQRRLMSSQLSMEREVARLRNAENQYRATFQLGSMPQMIVDADSLRITDVNFSAARLLEEPVQKLAGKKFTSLFSETNSGALKSFLTTSQSTTEMRETSLELETGEILKVSVSNFPQDGSNYLIVQLELQAVQTDRFLNTIERKVLALVNQMPDGFVLTDEDRNIISANTAFCNMVNIANGEVVEGKRIDHFFDRPNVDCNVLIANVVKHNVVRRFSSALRTQFGQVVNVDIAACLLQVGGDSVLGFWLRSTNNLVMGSEVEQENISRSNEQIANLVGHMPLKDIVRETTEMIEHLCIDTALELTQNNRASAAQMLGVSRQSLYSKLRKDPAKGD